MERIVGIALSLGRFVVLLEEGVTEAEAVLAQLREVAERVLGERTVPLYFGYRVRVGIR